MESTDPIATSVADERLTSTPTEDQVKTKGKGKSKAKGRLADFVHKLVMMATDPHSPYITWTEDGTAVSISDVSRFNEAFPSGQKQLYCYGFATTKNPPPSTRFTVAHPLVKKGGLVPCITVNEWFTNGSRSIKTKRGKYAARDQVDYPDSTDDEFVPEQKRFKCNINGGRSSSSAVTRGSKTVTHTHTVSNAGSDKGDDEEGTSFLYKVRSMMWTLRIGINDKQEEDLKKWDNEMSNSEKDHVLAQLIQTCKS
jgi:hypothetical protein